MSRPAGSGPRRSKATDVDSAASSQSVQPSDFEPEGADRLEIALAEIEADALEVYARAGLPTEPGHYRKPPDVDAWTFIAATLPPEARFALTLEHPPERGWRFARLQDLGARSDRPDLQAASRLLNDIADIRTARHDLLTQDHLLVAMELGGAWRALRDSKAVKASRLTLTPPSSPKKPRAKRDKGVKPR